MRLAKLRRRIEHDYREMKQALGLAHFEGRTWNGWHHHVTLVSAAHAFCTLQRLARNPKDVSSFAVSPPQAAAFPGMLEKPQFDRVLDAVGGWLAGAEGV